MSPIWHSPHHNYDPIYRAMPTEDLLPALECQQWDRAEAIASGDPTGFIDLQIADLQAEIARRERLRALPGASAWPAEPTPELRAYWAEIKERVSVVDLWRQHFPAQPLREKGRNWRGRCPLHGGHNPWSFSVYNGGRNWRCFSCQASGDVFALAGLLYRTTGFRGIADRLADEFGIERPRKMIPPDSNPLGVGSGGIISRRRKPAGPNYPEFIGGRAVMS